MMSVGTCLMALALVLVAPDARVEFVEAGEEALAADDLAMAAALYERGWLETQSLELLARAGLARARLGHRAHAAVYLAEVSARGEALGALQAEVQKTLGEAQAATVPLTVVVMAEAGELQVHATRGGTTGAPRLTIRVPVTTAGPQTLIVFLDPTEWSIVARTGERTIGSRRVTLAPGVAQGIEIGVRAVEASSPRRLVIAASSVGAGLVVGGALLTGISRLGLTTVVYRPNCAESRSEEDCSGPAATQTYRIGGGAFVLGAGAGALVAGLTGLVPRSGPRRIAWIAEAAGGGMLLALGAGLLGVGNRRFVEANTGPYPWERWRDGVDGASRIYGGGVGLIGAGLGLAAVSITGLVLESRQRRRPKAHALELRGGALWF